VHVGGDELVSGMQVTEGSPCGLATLARRDTGDDGRDGPQSERHAGCGASTDEGEKLPYLDARTIVEGVGALEQLQLLQRALGPLQADGARFLSMARIGGQHAGGEHLGRGSGISRRSVARRGAFGIRGRPALHAPFE
jgi:hypothetical protein